MARLGLGLMCAVQKPWDTAAEDFRQYQDAYARYHQTPAPPHVAVMFVFCDEDPGRARDLATHYIEIYYRAVMAHYELAGDHFRATTGYEYYAKGADTIQAAGSDRTTQFFTDLHVWGTPAGCTEKIMRMHEMGVGTFVANLSCGGMSAQEAERNTRLFARAVLPAIQAVAPPTLTAVR